MMIGRLDNNACATNPRNGTRPCKVVGCSRGDRTEARMSVRERLFKRLVEDGDANRQERLNGPSGPSLAASTRHAAANFFDDVNLTIEEIRGASVGGGVTCLVDASYPDMFRKLDNLKRMAQDTRVHVVACAGHYSAGVEPDFISALPHPR